MNYEDIVRASVALGVPREKAERAAAEEIAKRAAEGIDSGRRQPLMSPVARDRTRAHVGADRFGVCPASFSREGDHMAMMFQLPPRTKKNSTFLGIRQSPGYVRYRDSIVLAVREANDEFRQDHGLGLPLPVMPYNLAATFHVDWRGESADLINLLQGLADALENAGVVTNDNQFRRVDGSVIVIGSDTPRVELVISPIED